VDRGTVSVRWTVVPTPVQMSVNETRPRVNLLTGGWVIVQPSAQQLNNEAQYLAGIFTRSFLLLAEF